MIRIAHVCLSLGKGGAEKLLVDNLPFYVEKGHEVTIIQLSSILEEPSFIKSVENAGIKVITLSKGKFRNPLLFFKILKILNSGQFDIIHIHLFPTLYYFSLAARMATKSPILVLTEHSTDNGRSSKTMLQPLEKLIYKQYDKIIAISVNVESMLKQRFPELSQKIVLIRNGVNVDKMKSAARYDEAYFKENFGLQENDIKLFMASRFDYPKDQATIIRAMSFLPNNFHVFFAGDGPKLHAEKALAAHLNVNNRVHFLGFRSDIPQLMKSADLNILSSLYEGLSGVTLESLASAKPFLGSDVPGINDIVPNENFLFEKQNPEALAKKITEILNDNNLTRALSDKGLAHVSQFDSKIMVDAHIRLYENLLRLKFKPYI